MELIPIVAVLVPAAWYFCAASVAFTLLHTLGDEPFGAGGPFWDYYAARFGRGTGDPTGFALFVLLAAVLIALAVGGYLCGSELCVGALIGARLGDALVSHIGLRARFPGPNPGLATSPLYLLEAALAPWFFGAGAIGLVTGFGAFALFWTVSFVRRRSS